MNILGIETSCDETAAAIVENGLHVRSSVIASSQHDFERMGGVVPEQAARKQVECILPVIEEALVKAGITKEEIDAIAVTKGPGLIGSLLVGTTTARTLASIWKKPLIGVHHTLGHLSSVWLDTDTPPLFPAITLSVSGGHTDLWFREDHEIGVLLGSTQDDAAGEAFDKGASLLGLPYPGGPSISKAAQKGNADAYTFPLPLKEKDTLNFSFSGLKTALRYCIEEHPNATKEDLAASFEKAISNHLLHRLQKAVKQYPDAKEIHIVGGVSANTMLRNKAADIDPDLTVRFPALKYCTDNAAMIASAGFFMQQASQDAYNQFETRSSEQLTE